MLYIRARMISGLSWTLAKAVTISTRYSLVRRQFKDPDADRADAGQLERSVMSYPSLSRRLIPLLAKAYAMNAAGHRMSELYDELAVQLAAGNMTLLADAHIASSALKSSCTIDLVAGVESLRQLLGGHGFSLYSGFSGIYLTALPSSTFEGESVMLTGQVSRYVLKLVAGLRKDAAAAKKQLTDTTQYIALLADGDGAAPPRFQSPTTAAEWLRPSTYLAALDLRTARLAADVEAEIVIGGRRPTDVSWECVELSKSHADGVIARWFEDHVQRSVSADTKGAQLGDRELPWVQKLAHLNALTSLSRNIVPLALALPSGSPLARHAQSDSILTAESVRALDEAIRLLVQELVPQAIALTDAFGYTDWELGSALGRKDGRVYEALVMMAEGNPINHVNDQQHVSADGGANVGVYHFGKKGTGTQTPFWWKDEIKPILEQGARRAGDDRIRGDGSKL